MSVALMNGGGGGKKFRIPFFYFGGYASDNYSSWHVTGQLKLDTTDFKQLDIGQITFYGYESTYWFKITDDTNGNTLYYNACVNTHTPFTSNNLSFDVSNINQVTLQADGNAYMRQRYANVTDIVLS